MSLSNRAIEYLGTLKRDTNYITDKSDTEQYLINNNITPYDEFLRFQTLYSGYQLTIKDDPYNTFFASLFTREQIKTNNTLDIELAGDRFVEVCGEHKTAQFTFFITDRGEICTLDDDDSPNIIYSSFGKLIEDYAFKNEISCMYSDPYYYNLKKEQELTELINKEFEIVEECSDNYNMWWQNSYLIANKGMFLDGDEAYFHLYGINRTYCDKFIEQLKSKKIL
jgi:hypothetical protein